MNTAKSLEKLPGGVSIRLLDDVVSALERLRIGRSSKHYILTGKTAGVLDALGQVVETRGYAICRLDGGNDLAENLRSTERSLKPKRKDMNPDAAGALESAGRAARESNRGVVVLIDNLHRMKPIDLRDLITGLHAAAQDRLPVLMIGTAHNCTIINRICDLHGYADRMFFVTDMASIDNRYRHAYGSMTLPPARPHSPAP